ncbi:MAG: TatD family hydrolase [Dokdonella sp.]|uniref:TatD family hydrolase n=1 Tax=Dokdonella sp. TaxID=2291710 RepID=UPI0025BFA7DB|nr:TatD family hydrolase [Dokdonella sp.]MBX3700626.1 TatD family hydrolase [Dokdonella sp.]
MTTLVDSHCHLDAAEFAADRDAVLARARAAGVIAQVVPAIRLADFAELRELCAQHVELHPAYGLHPMYLADHAPTHLGALRDWLARESAVAVGECGLDHYLPGLDPARQRELFAGQLCLAREFDLPVIVHARHAVDEVIALLRRHAPLRGVVHSFAGSAEQARQLWNMGFLIGLGGPITYERARRLRALAATMPLEYLLLETDAPDQPLASHRGQRNEPAHLVEVAQVVAQLRGIDVSEVAAATRSNAQRLFALA